MGITEHEAILKLKDITQVFQAEDGMMARTITRY